MERRNESVRDPFRRTASPTKSIEMKFACLIPWVSNPASHTEIQTYLDVNKERADLLTAVLARDEVNACGILTSHYKAR